MGEAIKHNIMGTDYFRVETRDGHRMWLAVPAGMAKVGVTPVRTPIRAAA